MEAKKRLAAEVTAHYHGAPAVAEAAAHFARVHQERGIPDNIEECDVAAPGGRAPLPSALRQAGLVSSNTEARRLIEQGAVEVDGRRVTSVDEELPAGRTYLVRVGKRRFCRLVPR
jgi:tyrosyl-tRNA synthetase